MLCDLHPALLEFGTEDGIDHLDELRQNIGEVPRRQNTVMSCKIISPDLGIALGDYSPLRLTEVLSRWTQKCGGGRKLGNAFHMTPLRTATTNKSTRALPSADWAALLFGFCLICRGSNTFFTAGPIAWQYWLRIRQSALHELPTWPRSLPGALTHRKWLHRYRYKYLFDTTEHAPIRRRCSLDNHHAFLISR
jgi:hypothetical protein